MSLTPRQLIKMDISNKASATGGTWLEKAQHSEQQTPSLGAAEQQQRVILPKEEQQQLGSLSVAWKPQRLLLPKERPRPLLETTSGGAGGPGEDDGQPRDRFAGASQELRKHLERQTRKAARDGEEPNAAFEKAYPEQQTPPPLGAVEQRQQVEERETVDIAGWAQVGKRLTKCFEAEEREPVDVAGWAQVGNRLAKCFEVEERQTVDAEGWAQVEEAGIIINNEPAAEQSPTATAPDQAATTAAPPPPTRAPSRKVVVPPAAAVFFLVPESGIRLLDELLDLQQAPTALRAALAAPPAPERAAAAAPCSMELSAAAGPVEDDVLPLALLQLMYG